VDGRTTSVLVLISQDNREPGRQLPTRQASLMVGQ